MTIIILVLCIVSLVAPLAGDVYIDVLGAVYTSVRTSSSGRVPVSHIVHIYSMHTSQASVEGKKRMAAAPRHASSNSFTTTATPIHR